MTATKQTPSAVAAQPAETTATTNNGGPNGRTDENEEDWWSDSRVEVVAKRWDLSPCERDQFVDLRDRLRDVDHWKNRPDDVVRFLRARPGSVDDAESMFRAMMRWREENGVDTILDDYDPPAIVLEKYPGAILAGLDREGDPIYMGRLGVTDGVGLLEKFGREEMIRHAIWVREMVSRGRWIEEYEEKMGRPVHRCTVIDDMGGLTRRQLNRKMLNVYGEIMRIDQDNYCESAKRFIILRPPVLFRALWAIGRHFFDPGVVKKMIFTSESDYLKVLDQHVDREVLPPCVEGGKGKAVDGMPSNFDGGLVV